MARSDGLNTLILDLFLSNNHLFSSQDVNWWTGVVWITCGLLWCFYQLFGLSFWWHPFTAEDPLVSKWCNVTFLQICSDEETNSSTSWMAWEWANFCKNINKYKIKKDLNFLYFNSIKYVHYGTWGWFSPHWRCSHWCLWWGIGLGAHPGLWGWSLGPQYGPNLSYS